MGCVFGKQASGRAVERERAREESEEVEEEVRVKVAKLEVGEVRNGSGRRAAVEDGGNVRARGERSRGSRPNPRRSNLPKHVHGEQVAAGWPSWLSEVAGEAINGWTPRRADSFEKLDKVRLRRCRFGSSCFGFGRVLV